MSDKRTNAMADIDTELINAAAAVPGADMQADALDYSVPTPEPPVGIFPSEEAGALPRASLRERLAYAKEIEESKQTSILDKYKNSYKAFGYRAQGGVRRTSDLFSKLPMPGGILAPLIILVVLMFVIVGYNGKNRLNWLWLAFIGKARIQGEPGTSTTANGVNCGTGCQICTNNPFQCCASDGVSPCNVSSCPIGCTTCTNPASSSLSCCTASSGGKDPCTSTQCQTGSTYSRSLGICETQQQTSGTQTQGTTNLSSNSSIINTVATPNLSTGQAFSYVDYLGSTEYIG